MSIARKILMGAAGAAGGTTYVDDVFNTDVWKGDGAAHQVVNNISLSDEGGMVWMKSRSNSDNHMVADTVRGSNKVIFPDANAIEQTSDGYFTSFNSNGFTSGPSSYVNDSSKTFAAWTFRKAKGFFDVVTWSGNGTGGRQIAHNLGSVPGCIIIKSLHHQQSWQVYHRSLGAGSALFLDLDYAKQNGAQFFNNVEPTSTHFTLGTDCMNNCSGYDYVAYVFAGGASTAATAKSVHFTNQNGWMNTPADSAFAFGTGDFTVECWCKFDDIGNNGGLWNIATGTGIGNHNTIAAAWTSGSWKVYAGTGGQPTASGSFTVAKGPWYHVAYVRQSNNTKLYVNGTEVISTTDTTNYSSNQALAVGAYASEVYYTFDGKISNLRVIKGTALYTSSFNPPTKPLTNITNTTMLCCNDSSASGKTVGPSLTAWGSTAASSDSPFDDPEGFKFGEEEDQNIIKCGSFVGNTTGTATNRIELGFEPQWILFKNGTMQRDWFMFDCIRGISTDPAGKDRWIKASTNQQEENPGVTYVDLHSTGFTMTSSVNNYTNETITYMAIRRPDGYVGKPLESGEGTKALSMVYGNTSDPTFTTPFPVDFTYLKRPGATENWTASARLIDEKYLHTNLKNAEATDANIVFDYNNGFQQSSGYSSYLSWNWKRHAGFDVVCYKGNSVQGHDIPHNLGKVPEMMWVKNRTRTAGGGSDWMVYVGGITHLSVYGSDPDNFGNNPAVLELNEQEQANFSMSGVWDHTHPNSTHFRVGDTFATNENGQSMIAFLFASVEGISKVGYYSGQGSDLTIEFGFQPRFLMVKRTDAAGDWNIYDTTRGLVSGADQELRLNDTSSQTGHEVGDITSTGFTFACGGSHDTCSAGQTYIYYAHA